VLLETSAVNDKACRGDVISINCSADAVPPVTPYQLFENDTLILDTPGMWTKTFTTEGKFIYKCVANNSLGTGESASVTVTVNGNFCFFFICNIVYICIDCTGYCVSVGLHNFVQTKHLVSHSLSKQTWNSSRTFPFTITLPNSSCNG